MRRRGLAVLLGAVVLGVAGAQVPAAPVGVRIGVPVPLTGGLAEGGRDMVDGLTLYLEQHGRSLGVARWL